jgi:hypothetical protein
LAVPAEASAASSAWIEGPEPAAGCPKRTKAPAPDNAAGVDAARFENWPPTIRSWASRRAIGHVAARSVQPGPGSGVGADVGAGVVVNGVEVPAGDDVPAGAETARDGVELGRTATLR